MMIFIDDDKDFLEIIDCKLSNMGIADYKVFDDPLEASVFISRNNVRHVFTDFFMASKGANGDFILKLCEENGINCTLVSSYSKGAVLKIDFLQNIIKLTKDIA